tara:strand:- start:10250 stop:11203 length:954 start_codon:yes stop_codon:yes gene_type:complete
MKIIVKISGLYLLLCCSVITAQDLQKWYADDLYYNSNEKETNIIEIVEYSEYDNEIDTLEESFDNQMSYTSRINRFHRDYYGTSLGFNYGYFHDPFLFNGFGFNYGFDPFFNYGFGFNYGFDPFFGLGFYNPLYSPWGINQFAWYDPYGFGYWGGFGYNPYFFNTGLTVSSGNAYYGPRNSGTNNVISTINTRPVNRSSNSHRTGINKTQKPTSEINSTTVFGQEKYTIPKNKQTRWEVSNSINKNKTEKKSFINRIEQILGSDTPQPRVNSNSNSSNRKNKSTYSPSPQRSSNATRTAPRSTPRTNRSSTNSRRPR